LLLVLGAITIVAGLFCLRRKLKVVYGGIEVVVALAMAWNASDHGRPSGFVMNIPTA